MSNGNAKSCGFKNYIKEYASNYKKKFKIKNYVTYIIFVVVIAILTGLNAGGQLNNLSRLTLERIGYSIIMATSLSLVVGFLGELSLGHAGFICLGAYFGTFFQNTVFPSLTVASPLIALILAMLIGGLIAGVFGFIIGLPALRLKGDYLAIVTLAFGEIVRTVFQNLDAFGGPEGLVNNYRYDKNRLFLVTFIVAFLALVLINNFIRSKHGRAVTSIRDNEIASKAMGVNVTFYKLSVFIFSSFLAGVAGALLGGASNRVDSATFDYNYSINILVMVVLGGMGNINGSIIAATLIAYINALPLPGEIAVFKNLFFALILILIVVYNNSPKLKTVRTKYNFSVLFNFLKSKIVALFSKRKHKKEDPSVEKEFGADWSKVPTKIEMDAILSTDITPDKSYTPDKADAEPNDGQPKGE